MTYVEKKTTSAEIVNTSALLNAYTKSLWTRDIKERYYHKRVYEQEIVFSRLRVYVILKYIFVYEMQVHICPAVDKKKLNLKYIFRGHQKKGDETTKSGKQKSEINTNV